MAEGFREQLKARIGKKVGIKFDKDSSLGGKLANVLDDHIALETDDAAHSMVFIPIDKIIYFYEPRS